MGPTSLCATKALYPLLDPRRASWFFFFMLNLWQLNQFTSGMLCSFIMWQFCPVCSLHSRSRLDGSFQVLGELLSLCLLISGGYSEIFHFRGLSCAESGLPLLVLFWVILRICWLASITLHVVAIAWLIKACYYLLDCSKWVKNNAEFSELPCFYLSLQSTLWQQTSYQLSLGKNLEFPQNLATWAT